MATESEVSDQLDEVMVSIADSSTSQHIKSVWDETYDLISFGDVDVSPTGGFNQGVEQALEETSDPDVRDILQVLDEADLDDESLYNVFHELSDSYQIPRHTTGRGFREIVLDVSGSY